MKITIEFSTDNASWRESPNLEIGNILQLLEDLIDTELWMPFRETEKSIIDANGNTIGTITLEVE